MSSKWHQKKARQAEFAFEKALQGRKDEAVDQSVLTKDSAMGGGVDDFYEKKLTKEEKKALAKKKREAKKAAKGKGKKKNEDESAKADEALAAKMKALTAGAEGGDANRESRGKALGAPEDLKNNT